jgi:hypothetical protein
MKKCNIDLKTLISCVLTFAVLTVFSFPSYAAPDTVKKPANDIPKTVTEAPEGVLTLSQSGALIATGSVSVNGNAAKSGITVLSGSTIATGADGVAMLDLTPFGRVTLGPGTTAKITYGDGNLLVQTTCNDMRVAVKQGQCNVTSPNGTSKVLTAGQDEHFDSPVEVTANGVTDVVISCGRDVVCPPPIVIAAVSRFPLFALFLLGGAATAVTAGVVAGGPTQPSTPPVSAFRP